MNYQYNTQAKMAEELVVDYPLKKVIYAVAETADQGKGFSLEDCNELLHRVTVKTKASLFSWGEILTIQCDEVSENKTRISISSQMKTSIGSQSAGAQATISRKNKKNIDNFLNLFSHHLSNL